MPDRAERTERAARTARRGPASARARRATDRRALLLAAAGLTLAGAVLAGSVSGGPRGDGVHKAPGHAVAEPAEDGIAPAAEPEPCADGRDPAESYSAERLAGDAVERIRDRGQLIVGVDQNSYLWGYRSPETGEIVGFDLDLVQAIADDLVEEGVLGEDAQNPVKYLAIPTDQRTRAIRDQEVDMVVRAMSITCDRWEEVAFSTAYFETGQQLLVPRNSPIDGYDASLAGKTVCSAAGSTAETWLEHESHGAELVAEPNHLDCLVHVQLGLADALMTDSALAAGHIAQDPSMRLIGEPLTVESYGVAMNLNDVDLVRWVNAVLEDYRDGGSQSRWAQAADRWLQGYLYPQGEPPPAPPQPQYRD
ncbi:glutamate ABC transporter substrate-binding protein [Streptomyces sp. MP131-18]|uniref:glutamate ABC transporter substrate-binding protein n=1 Tax=Streptomyces sp. MP131-18 TaxID=1857892 RepID=UPI0009A1F5C5|nr:glutamate ABC transporter substrate-binding protein [Streptomyces sp. MP131-18]ONK14239.1 ABC transporter glutamine-binding protein GlnH precursor [Streptomyces sp. MP131-18]